MAKKIKTRSRSKVGTIPKKKLKWEPFKITRVKLNPEQAVLSCCNDVGRVETMLPYQMCVATGPDVCELPSSAISS